MEAEENAYKRALLDATKGSKCLEELREDVDNAEWRVGNEFWELATYDELLL